MGPDAVVHVFGEHEPLVLGERKVRWVPRSRSRVTPTSAPSSPRPPSRQDGTAHAEVLYSERPATDSDPHREIIGRMVRTPLAHRITTDDALNTVSCYLPLFNRGTLEKIIGAREGEGGTGSDPVIATQVFERNASLEADVFVAVESIPSLPAPDRLASPLRRAKLLATLPRGLAQGQGSARRRRGNRADNGPQRPTRRGRPPSSRPTSQPRCGTGGDVAQATSTDISGTERTVERRSVRITSGTSTVTPGGWCVPSRRGRYRLPGAPLSRGRRRRGPVRCPRQVAAPLRVPGVIDSVEERATEWVQGHSPLTRRDRQHDRQSAHDFRRVQEQTSTPEPVTVELLSNLRSQPRTRRAQAAPPTNGTSSPVPTGSSLLCSTSGSGRC
ncbi:MAG: hypothetical protein M5U19_11025 [Microthrixaceae bacterium]|nr:hypothetical protein [Microthrixaceae bacterium]